MISIKESISTSVISSPDHIEAITVKLHIYLQSNNPKLHLHSS